MRRDFIVVFGNQGAGKSVWTKEYCKALSRLVVFDPLASFPNVDFATAPDEYIPRILATPSRVPFRFGSYYRDELAALGHFAFATGDCTFAIEECSLIFKRGEQLEDWALPLVFLGRHQRVNLVLVAQRATKIPIDLRSQASRIITFRQTEPDDVAALADRIGKQYQDEISTLPDLECLDWEAGSVRRYRVTP